MQCLILAGGLGTRMQKITKGQPKALLPVGARTFLDWQLEWLRTNGITEAVLALGVGANQIQAHLKDSPPKDLKVRISEDGPQPVGTGGAIRAALPLLQDDFLVTYGDSFLFMDVKKMWDAHFKAGLGVTLSIFKNKNQGDRSNIRFDGHRILKYDKFSPDSRMEYIDYGMSVVKKNYFQAKAPSGKFDFADVISRACEEKQLAAFVAEHAFMEVGSSTGYQSFCEKMAASGYNLKTLKASVESPKT